MSIDRRLLAGALGIVMAVAACGGSSSASPGSTTAPATPAAVTPAPTVAAATDVPEPTDVPGAEPSPTDDGTGADPSFAAGAAGDLEAMLPDEAGGVKYQKSSFDGASIGMLAGSVDTAQLDPILKANGKTVNDVRVAIATPADSSSSTAGMVVAFQIRGLDASKFLEAMGADPTTMTRTSIGGKDVYQAGAGGFGAVVYPKDDIVFEILLADPKVTEAILSKLP